MWALFGCLSVLLHLAGSAQIRGVSPSLHSHYDASADTFRCLDGSKLVPKGRVNDDYCDCMDGSDEPGTSACSNGRFYCRNRGHQPLVINASFVDDGICDCCDGSDEQQGCKNTCQAAGAAARQDLVTRSKDYAAGAKVRQKYITQFAADKQTWQRDLDRVSKEIGPQQKLTDEVRAEKEAAEQVERDRKAAEQAAQKEEEAKPADAVTPDNTVNTGEQTVPQDEVGSETISDPLAANLAAELAADEASAAANGKEGEEEAPATTTTPPAAESGIQTDQTVDTGSQHVIKESIEEEEEELSADEMGRRIASQWTTDPEAAGSSESSAPATGASSQGAADAGAGLEAATAASEGAAAFFAGQPSLEALSENIKSRAAAIWDLSKDWVSDKLGSSYIGASSLSGKEGSTQVKALQDRFHKQSGRLTDLQNQQRDLESKLKHDYGLEGVFGALVDKCFETQVDKYTYSVCPFKDAHQKEGVAKTSLGSWGGFDDNYTVMKFEGGQGCWQGPARSMTVAVKCGSAEKLSRVEEPSRCEYIAELQTPAACTSQIVQAVHSKLAALESDSEDDHTEL